MWITMKIFVTLLLFFASDLLGVLSDEFNDPCPRTSIRLHNSCFQFSKDRLSWMESYFKCKGSNSTLINSQLDINDLSAMTTYLRKGYLGDKDYWLGALYNDKLGEYIWADSGDFINPVKYKKFYKLKKQYKRWDCLALKSVSNYKWFSVNCMKPKNYICVSPIKENEQYFRENENSAVPDIISFVSKSTTKHKHSTNWESQNAPGNLLRPEVRRTPKSPKAPKVTPSAPKYRYQCPRQFRRANKYCYHFSRSQLSWQEAYFYCQSMTTTTTPNRSSGPVNATLAIAPDRRQDRALRRLAARVQLTGGREREARWLGGRYDWVEKAWRWAESGRMLQHEGASGGAAGGPQVDSERLKWHCLLWDPNIVTKWTTSNCSTLKYFLCQTKAEKVINPPNT